MADSPGISRKSFFAAASSILYGRAHLLKMLADPAKNRHLMKSPNPEKKIANRQSSAADLISTATTVMGWRFNREYYWGEPLDAACVGYALGVISGNCGLWSSLLASVEVIDAGKSQRMRSWSHEDYDQWIPIFVGFDPV